MLKKYKKTTEQEINSLVLQHPRSNKTILDEALLFNGKPLLEVTALVVVLEVTALALVVGGVDDGVDDGPMTTCEMEELTVITEVKVFALTVVPGCVETVAGVAFGEFAVILSVLPVGGRVPGRVPVLVLGIVTTGRPVTVSHAVANVWMRPCAVETVPGVGSLVTAQLTQTCRLWTTAAVQRQLTVVQDVTDDWMGVQVAVH